MASGEKPVITTAAPNAPMADRRLNIPVNPGPCRATFERSMICSIGSFRRRTNATLHRWFSDLASTAIELSQVDNASTLVEALWRNAVQRGALISD